MAPINAAAHNVKAKFSAKSPRFNRLAQAGRRSFKSLSMAGFYGGFCSLFVQPGVNKPFRSPLESPNPNGA